MGGLNLALFRAINGWSDSWAPFWRFFSEAANHLWFKVAALVLVLAMLAIGRQTRITVLIALIAFPIANGITDLFKHLLPEPRPFQELANVALRGVSVHNQSHGTASAHAANMAALAFAFTYGLGWWGLPWILIALLTGLSRIYVGAHYPYQVLLGWTCGIASGWAVAAVVKLIQTKKPRASADEAEALQPAPR